MIDAGTGGEVADARLGQRRAARRHRQDRAAIGDAVDRRGEDVGAQHHPRPAARRRVVDRAMLVGREIADVDRVERPLALAQRPPASEMPSGPGNISG